MRAINAIRMGGGDVLPLIEGGKGVSISNGLSAGNWALMGGVGTFSAVNADSFDVDGRPIPQVYHGRTRRERPPIHIKTVGIDRTECPNSTISPSSRRGPWKWKRPCRLLSAEGHHLRPSVSH